MIDVAKLRADTPCTSIYFNHVSSAVPPDPVMHAIHDYFVTAVKYGTNSRKADDLALGRYFQCKDIVARFIGAKGSNLMFTANGSEAISLVANGLKWQAGDNVVVDELSFVGNVAPWFSLRERCGVEVRFAPCVKPGLVDLDALEALVDGRTKLISLNHMPNSLGIVQPAQAVGEIAKRHGVLYMLDAANTVGLADIDVEKIGCDFLAATGRKNLRGPVGVGFLYISDRGLAEMQPVNPAWNNCAWEWPEDFDWQKSRIQMVEGIEALSCGEINFPSVFGLTRAVEYIDEVGGRAALLERVAHLTDYMMGKLADIPDLEIYGNRTSENRIGTFGLNIRGVDFEKLSEYLDQHNVVTQGHTFYCPGVLKMYGISGLLRVCLHAVNTEEEIDAVVELLRAPELRA